VSGWIQAAEGLAAALGAVTAVPVTADGGRVRIAPGTAAEVVVRVGFRDAGVTCWQWARGGHDHHSVADPADPADMNAAAREISACLEGRCGAWPAGRTAGCDG
jgi:hypothetical protein